MSEQAPRPEQQTQPKEPEYQVDRAQKVELDPSREIESGLPTPEALSKAAESQAVSAKEFAPSESENQAPHSLGLHQELKTSSYNKTLDSVRRHLNGPEKALSKIIHAKGIEPVTNVAAKTVGRPSGLLGGAIAGLIASSYLLYMSKHYGYTYRYSTFIIFFLFGFAIGLLIEMLTAPLRRRRSSEE